MHYDLLLPARVVFGWERRKELGRLAATLGRRAFLVTGSQSLERQGVIAELCDILQQTGVEALHIGRATGEPTIQDVDALTATLRSHAPAVGEVVIGVGGGAGLDLAKAVSAMATNARGRSVREFLEGVGTGATLDAPPLPLIAIPTTAGTGTEATKNAVISADDPPCKKSLRADSMVPRIALIDPELTVSNSRSVTAASGMDAITQLIESYISCRAQPVPRALCLDGLRTALPALRIAVAHPADRGAREAMAHAAFLSGVALANSGLGLAHGVAAALGAVCNVSHGLACATLLPIALRVNRDACVAHYAQLEREVGETSLPDETAAEAFIERIDVLCRDVGIPPRLRDLGVRREQLPSLAEGSKGNSLSGNPIPLSSDQVLGILEKHW